jgi:hypothetical protein
MQLNARIDSFNGNGNKVYQVTFANPYEMVSTDEINVEIWLANDEEHLMEQLFEEFVVEGTYEEETFYEAIVENSVAKQIGTVINITND